MAGRQTKVIVEVGSRRVFASALDWPGWCRAAKDEEGALASLAAYAPRYAVVAERAGVPFRPAATYDVVDRVDGDATTDFGAPGRVTAADAEPLSAAEARRQVALLRAAWAELDRLAVEAPEVLRKGPRGGGRDRDKMVAHVLGAEGAYARKVGVRHPEPGLGDSAAIEAARADLSAVLEGARSGEPVVERGWPPRYALRRVAWHVLDHVWEIEDKSEA